MNTKVYEAFSPCLNREMAFKEYGFSGKKVLVFAPQNGTYHDYEDFGMIDRLADWINQGSIHVFTVGSVDAESWSDENGDPRRRSWLIEQFYYYIVDELVPVIHQISANTDPILTTGCSMGAAHAANFFFRRPDLFDSVIALSGVYDAFFFFHGYMDERVYNNSPIDYIGGMPLDHPWLEKYRHNQMIFCVGQGAYEDEMIASTRRLQQTLGAKNVNNAWFDYWGYDVRHDWDWWQKQIAYFMGKMLES